MNPETPSSSDWSLEICLDSQWIHAICPYANITIIEAESEALTDLVAAINMANSMSPKPNIVSMSFGFQELYTVTNTITDNIFDPEILYVASSGDSNYVSWPSSNPNVLCVAGTTLTSNSNKTTFVSESTWLNTGCGPSIFFPIPDYQNNNVKDITGDFRLCGDISMDANPNTGVYVYSQGSYQVVGGTSLSAPLISGTMAIIMYQRLLNNKPTYNSNQNSGYGIQNLMYNIYGTDTNMYNYLFYDVVTGSSGQYSASKGYDYPTGLGSPYIPTFVTYFVEDSISTAYQVTATASVVAPDPAPAPPSNPVSVPDPVTDLDPYGNHLLGGKIGDPDPSFIDVVVVPTGIPITDALNPVTDPDVGRPDPLDDLNPTTGLNLSVVGRFLLGRDFTDVVVVPLATETATATSNDIGEMEKLKVGLAAVLREKMAPTLIANHGSEIKMYYHTRRLPVL
jgi:hypothetical protein